MKKLFTILILALNIIPIFSQQYTLYNGGGNANVLSRLSESPLRVSPFVQNGSSDIPECYGGKLVKAYSLNGTYWTNNFIPDGTLGNFTLVPVNRFIETTGYRGYELCVGAITMTQQQTINFSQNGGRFYQENDNTASSITFNVVQFDWNRPVHSVCSNDADFDLKQFLTFQGSSITFSGTGVFNTVFKPSVAGPGDHIVTATRVFSNGTASKSFIVRVRATYNDQAATLGAMWTETQLSFCRDEPSLNLISKVRFNQSNSIFSWTGGVGNSFDPAVYPLVTNIKYTYTNANNCVTEHNIPVRVDPAFTVNTSTNKVSYCTDASLESLRATPSGGTWTSASTPSGLETNSFRASAAGVGTHILTYRVTQGACSKSANLTVNVFALPPTRTGGDLEFCNNTGGLQQLNRSNTFPTSGGTWSFIGNAALNTRLNQANATVNITGLANGNYPLNLTFTNDNGCIASSQALLKIQDVLNAPIVSESFSCAPSQVTMQIASPQNNVIYKWYDDTTKAPVFSPGSSFLTPFINLSKDYFVSVENQFGCESSFRKVTAQIRTPVRPNPGRDTSICNNSASFNLTGFSPLNGTFESPYISSGGTNQWSFNPVGLPSGSYPVRYLTTINGCPSSATRSIIVREPVIVDAGFNQEVCFGGRTAIGANAFPVGGTYSFSVPSLNSTLSVDGNGTTFVDASVLEVNTAGYPITYLATDPITGCSASDQLLLFVRALPESPSIAPAVSCGPAFASLEITNYNSNNVYEWYNDINRNVTLQNNNLQRYQPLTRVDATTSYFVRTRNFARCLSDLVEVRFVVNPLPVVIASNDIICLNNTTFDLANLVTPAGGLFTNASNTSQINNIIFPQTIGVGSYVYNYEVENTFGCKRRVPFQIQVVSSLAGNILPADTSICRSSPSINLPILTNLNSGTFSGPGVEFNFLTLRDVQDPDNKITISYEKNENGCVFQDEMNITILNSPAAPSISGVTSGCIGQNLNFTTERGTGITYAWFKNGNPIAFSTLQSVTAKPDSVQVLTLETRNTIGCVSIERALVNLAVNNPSPSFTVSDTLINSGELIEFAYTGSTATALNWAISNNTTGTGAIVKKYIYSDVENYMNVSLSATNLGCTSIIRLDSAFKVIPNVVESPSASDDNTNSGFVAGSYLEVYPNPMSDKVHFKIVNDSYDNYTVNIYNVSGILVKSTVGEDIKEIDMSAYPSSIYTAILSNASSSKSFKLIKE